MIEPITHNVYIMVEKLRKFKDNCGQIRKKKQMKAKRKEKERLQDGTV